MTNEHELNDLIGCTEFDGTKKGVMECAFHCTAGVRLWKLLHPDAGILQCFEFASCCVAGLTESSRNTLYIATLAVMHWADDGDEYEFCDEAADAIKDTVEAVPDTTDEPLADVFRRAHALYLQYRAKSEYRAPPWHVSGFRLVKIQKIKE